MANPWEKVDLESYEKHMSLDSVKQLQTLNSIMKEQFDAYPVNTAMVLGIAGGNGIEHVDKDKFDTVYGVDVNDDYLKVVSERYPELNGVLKCLQIDLINDSDKLPKARLVIANLLIEYIGYRVFQNAIRKIEPDYVSCVIQINIEEKAWVSDSPYIHEFDCLDEVHVQVSENDLVKTMEKTGYKLILKKSEELPNGKAFVRLDFAS
ncbi:MAG: methyltransferase type 11 [Clostridiales bacterium]|nr:methyltransferase type 11 [Clostridiales bacterium]